MTADAEDLAEIYVTMFFEGPLDGWREVREGALPKFLKRRWYSFDATRGQRCATVYVYALKEPVLTLQPAEYWLADVELQSLEPEP